MDSPRATGSPMLLQEVKQASQALHTATRLQKDEAVRYLIEQFEARIDDVLEANTLDLEISRDLALPSVLLHWLKLTPNRLQQVVSILEQLLDPLCFAPSGALSQLGGGLSHYSPVGVVGFIYEALPELALILAGMCLKTGNGLVLRGGTETSHTNIAIASIIQAALEQAKLPDKTIISLSASSQMPMESMVKAGSGIDLIIPYGRPSLVQRVCAIAEVPIIKTSIGNCYLFWSSTGSVEQVQTIISHSHRGHPEAVNAIDKVIIPSSLQRPLLNLLWDKLEEEGFEIQGDQELCSEFPDLTPANPEVWGQPALRKVVTFKLVDTLQKGIQWINTYSSGHGDCIVSDSYKEIHSFMQLTHSACLFINRSPEFSRLKGQFHTAPAFCMAQRGGTAAGVIDLHSLLKTQAIYQGGL